MKTLYTAVATATEGGRDGHVETDDGKISFELDTPEGMGGTGGPGTNPEQLFASGYAACFANAMRATAWREDRLEAMEGVTVTAHVDIGALGKGRFGLAVQLDVQVPAVAQEEADDLVAKAHDRCPFSNATRGNIELDITVHAGG